MASSTQKKLDSFGMTDLDHSDFLQLSIILSSLPRSQMTSTPHSKKNTRTPIHMLNSDEDEGKQSIHDLISYKQLIHQVLKITINKYSNINAYCNNANLSIIISLVH